MTTYKRKTPGCGQFQAVAEELRWSMPRDANTIVMLLILQDTFNEFDGSG
jgi:hypothetical protein